MMVPAKQGLIVQVSSGGGMRYLFNVAYGVGKAAVSVNKSHRSFVANLLPDLLFIKIIVSIA